MERINKFLENRPKKHQKVLLYRGERYEITKEDLKKVRAFRASKCLDPSFKLSRPLDLSFSAKPADAFPSKPKKDLSDHYNKKILENIKKGKYEKNTVPFVDKNQIVDIWENDNLETIKAFQQEWVYSIKDPYDRPVEQLSFSKEHLEEELKRVYAKHFTPRDEKEKTIQELLPKLPDAKDLRPFPEFRVKEWNIENHIRITEGTVCSFKNENLEVWNLKYNVRVAASTLPDKIKNALSVSTGAIVAQTSNMIYALKDGQAFPVIESKKRIKDSFMDKRHLVLLSGCDVHIHDTESFSFIRTVTFKNESARFVKMDGDTVIAATPNGLFVHKGEEILQISYLNYVVDFAVKGDRIYVINNLNRLIVLDKTFTVIKTVVQHEMGREVRVHRLLNLIAISFSREVVIYKSLNGEIVPAHSLPGEFRGIEWDDEMPWLYAGCGNRIVMYS